MVWRRNVLLQLDPDHHCAVDPWYFGLDPQIRTSDSRIWIYIRIRLRIHDILVQIRRSEPLQLNPHHHCDVDPWYFVPDPQIRTTDSRIWIRIRIRIRIRILLFSSLTFKMPIRDPEKTYAGSRIQGSKSTQSRIRIRNTAKFFCILLF